MTQSGAEVLSQFKIELVRLNSGHVGLVNSAGYYLSAWMDDLGWYMKTPHQEEMFTVETHGEFDAYRSHEGKYLNINKDGFLELLSAQTEVADSQLFTQQNGEASLTTFLALFIITGYSGEFEAATLLTTMPKWGPEFYVSLDVFFNSIKPFGKKYGSVIHFTTSGYDKHPDPGGYRIPGVWTRDDSKLLVYTEIDNKLEIFEKTIATNTWYKVEIEQKKNHKGEVKNTSSCVSCV